MHHDAVLPPDSSAEQEADSVAAANVINESIATPVESTQPCPRWSVEEQAKLGEMRHILQADLAAVPQYLEVVGDRRLLRFLRGHNYDMKKATFMYRKFLKYRKDYRVDSIRDRICMCYAYISV